MDIKNFLIVLAAAMLLLSCSKDGEPNPSLFGQQDPKAEEEVKNSEKQILSFRFPGIDNNGVIVEIPGEIDQEGKTIEAKFPSGTVITAMTPEVEISEKAVYEPAGPQDFSKPINYTVTAEDGTSRTYLVTVEVALTQKEVLLKIAEANPESKLEWRFSDDLSDWKEVTLDGSGNVIALDLKEVELKQIPSQIAELSSLKKLYLVGNQLKSIPVEIGQLSSLEVLTLSENQLQSIPAEIGQLSLLTILYLGKNQLQSIPTELGQLSLLKGLGMDNNQLQSIPAELGQLSSLVGLYLNDNLLQAIPVELGQLASLEYLWLEGNNIQSLPKEVCDMDDSNGGPVDIDIVEGGICNFFTTTSKD